MARTKASIGAKISSGKSSKARCSAAPPAATTGVSSGTSDKAARSSGGGNPVCPRETPKWQRPITNFFINKANDSNEVDEEDMAAGSSKPKPKRNIIQSSDEENSPEKPKNKELDETIELEILTGEKSHKIQEYYPKESKGKGVGKKTTKKQREKENLQETEGDSNTGHEKNTENGESETENLEATVEKDNNIDDKRNGASDTGNLQETIERDTNITDVNTATDKENVDSNVGVTKTEDIDRSDKDSNSNVRSKRERDEGQEESVSKKIRVC